MQHYKKNSTIVHDCLNQVKSQNKSDTRCVSHLQNKRVLMIRHLKGWGLPRFRYEETKHATLWLEWLGRGIELEHVAPHSLHQGQATLLPLLSAVCVLAQQIIHDPLFAALDHNFGQLGFVFDFCLWRERITFRTEFRVVIWLKKSHDEIVYYLSQ